MYTIEYYSAVRWNHAYEWISKESSMLSEVSQKKRANTEWSLSHVGYKEA